jgi:hypothetical protein
MAATPAARAAFLATRLTFGSKVFFAFAGVFDFIVFLIFELARARFDADLAFVRLTRFVRTQFPRGAEVAFGDGALRFAVSRLSSEPDFVGDVRVAGLRMARPADEAPGNGASPLGVRASRSTSEPSGASATR